MSKNTMTDLVLELEKLTSSEIKYKMIAHAKEGSFHDFRSKAVCGKMYFVQCAQQCKKVMKDKNDLELIERLEKEIKNGVYDETCTEEDKKYVFEEMENDKNMSEKDKQLFKTLFK